MSNKAVEYCEAVAKLFNKANFIKSCLPASIVLSEVLNANDIPCYVAIGYAVGKEIKRSFRHVWVIDARGNNYDVGQVLTQLHDPTYPDWYELSQTIPENHCRLDRESELDSKNQDLFETALKAIQKSGTKLYWKKYATPSLRRLRKQIHLNLISASKLQVVIHNSSLL